MKTPKRYSALAPAIAIVLTLFVSACDGTATNDTAKPVSSKSTSEEGLILEDITVGEGAAAATASAVAVHYTGWLFDETHPENKGLEAVPEDNLPPEVKPSKDMVRFSPRRFTLPAKASSQGTRRCRWRLVRFSSR